MGNVGLALCSQILNDSLSTARQSQTVVALFTGAMGLDLDLGFEAAGFKVRVAVDSSKYAAATVAGNRPGPL